MSISSVLWFAENGILRYLQDKIVKKSKLFMIQFAYWDILLLFKKVWFFSITNLIGSETDWKQFFENLTWLIEVQLGNSRCVLSVKNIFTQIKLKRKNDDFNKIWIKSVWLRRHQQPYVTPLVKGSTVLWQHLNYKLKWK